MRLQISKSMRLWTALLALLLFSHSVAAQNQSGRQRVGDPPLREDPSVPPDVPAEFKFLYGDGILSGQLQAVWAALPYESIALERGSDCMGGANRNSPACPITTRRAGKTNRQSL